VTHPSTDRPERRRTVPGRAAVRIAAALALLLGVGIALWAPASALPTTAGWVDAVNTDGDVRTATVTDATDVVAGNVHSCALADGEVWCTGGNDRGQLGTGTTTPSDVLVGPVAGALAGKKVTAIDAGDRHTCAVADGEAYCWGDNSAGQIGAGGAAFHALPMPIPARGGSGAVTELELGATGSCVVAGGAGYCWGQTLGPAGTTAVPVAISGGALPRGATVTDIAIGGTLGCLLADGAPYCWGANDVGQLGNGSSTPSAVPVTVRTTGALQGAQILDISVGGSSACVIGKKTSAGPVLQAPYCWGDNTWGQLGTGTTGGSVSAPVAIAPGGELAGTTVETVDLGDGTTCASKANGIAYCWGNNSAGQTGTNSIRSSVVNRPKEVDRGSMSEAAAGTRFVAVDVDSTHGCGAGTDGLLYCWGLNDSGELGTGGYARAFRPQMMSLTWSGWAP
jgi:alpha-tubulin suppressor-like RCC1 family protein